MSSFDEKELEFLLGKTAVHDHYRKVMEVDGQPIAFIEGIVYYDYTKYIWIEIGVHKNYRQMGYMEKIFKVFLRDLKRDHPNITKVIASVNKQNEPSNKFMLKQGFTRVVPSKFKDISKTQLPTIYNYYELEV
jgi:RimJ/RimL family protein N-acetyltransferase